MDTFHLILIWGGYAVAVLGLIVGWSKPIVLTFSFAQITAKSQKLQRQLAEVTDPDDPDQALYISDADRRAGDRREGLVQLGGWPYLGGSVVIALLSAILHRLVIT